MRVFRKENRDKNGSWNPHGYPQASSGKAGKERLEKYTELFEEGLGVWTSL